LDDVTLLYLHEAKTAAPGKTQVRKLKPLQCILCPVRAIKRRMETITNCTDTLFGFMENEKRVNLTKQQVNTVLAAVWTT
jgi:hypothetical protein